jgi:hypothetical protein
LGASLLSLVTRATQAGLQHNAGLEGKGQDAVRQQRGARDGAQASRCSTLHWHTQGHLVFFKRDDEKFQGQSRDLLFFDRNDPADAMRRVNHELVRAEFSFLGLGHSGRFLEGTSINRRQVFCPWLHAPAMENRLVTGNPDPGTAGPRPVSGFRACL